MNSEQIKTYVDALHYVRAGVQGVSKEIEFKHDPAVVARKQYEQVGRLMRQLLELPESDILSPTELYDRDDFGEDVTKRRNITVSGLGVFMLYANEENSEGQQYGSYEIHVVPQVDDCMSFGDNDTEMNVLMNLVFNDNGRSWLSLEKHEQIGPLTQDKQEIIDYKYTLEARRSAAAIETVETIMRAAGIQPIE